MKQQPTHPIKTTIFALLLSCLLLAASPAYAASSNAATAPLLQASCTLPATVTTASQLRDCITAANGNGAGLDTITLGADINLTLTLPQITTAITLEGAGYTLDGGNSRQIFNVGYGGDLTINEATLQNGFATSGGAIYNAGTVTLIKSTLSGNNATSGAAVFNYVVSTFTATNSTFSGNSATNLGGAIYNLDTMILTSNTFADNAAPTGGSIYNATPRGYLAGNIFAKGTNGANCVTGAAINDNGYNLSDDATCTNGGTGSATNATLSLGVLADNGGSTQTHLPGAGSAAIGAIPYGYSGNNNGLLLACNHTTTDQIGQYRPPIANSACTSGALESEPLPTGASLTIIKDANPADGTDFDFTIGAAPLTSYSGSTSGHPFWTRPNEGGTCTLSTVSTRYHVQPFVVDTSGNYNLSSGQSGLFDGYIHLYQDSFNPLVPCTNYLNGDDNVIFAGTSEILGQFLESGRTYYFVVSGNSSSDAGNFTNYIEHVSGGGNAYTLYDAFTLDDAVPDDGDSVSSTVTYNVEPSTYRIIELLPNSDWSLTNATCTGASGTVSLTDQTLSVEISNGEAVQCTFTNERICSSWTVTTAAELSDCITLANTNESPSPTADTITLGADITLSTALPQITSEITLEGAGYAVDGGDSVQLFYVASAGDFTVNQATLQNGYSATDGGGSYNRGTLTVSNSTFSGNRAGYGGGIYNDNSGMLTVSNSTFSNNSASFGGGIYNNGTLMVSNSTFSNNSASNGGGGIYNYYGGRLTVSNSTFSDNRAGYGGGVYNTIGTVYLAGTVFVVGSGGDNCTNDGTLHDNGYNLSDDASCGFRGTSANNATLNLGDLADNGGSTLTHLPGVGSDAIGAIPYGTTINNNGTSWTCDQSATDQRGASRPITLATACTAGAIEVELPPACPSWTATTAAELSDCINLANANESPSPTADIITLGTDITLSTALPQITSEITLEGANHFIDGGWNGVPSSGTGIQIFTVNLGGDLTIKDTVLQNGSARNGGGIYNDGRLTVINSTISSNNAYYPTGETYGGGILNNGTLAVTNSTISGNSAFVGGGIRNNGLLTVNNSTFSGNSAYDGGGIYNNGTLTVTNGTFSDNTSEVGGGIVNGGTLTVSNSTFSDNSVSDFGGGIYNRSGTAHLAGNLFVADTPDNCFKNGGTFHDNGYNLSDDASCGFSGIGSANNATLSLGNLADNGGSTQTHLPSAGSDAIGAIPNGTTSSNNGTSWTCDQSASDQRGVSRPINSGDACTAGAVEVTPICTSWTVTTAAELSDCITLANANESPSPTADTITLGADITLTTALPQITSEITLEGAGYAVDGGNSVQLFYVTTAGNFTVNQAVLQNGSAPDGGAIYNDSGTLTVTDSNFSDNSADFLGGGIYNGGLLTVIDSTFSGNEASSFGGGIFNGNTLTVSNSTFSSNSASGYGGGISNWHTATVSNSTFSSNSANSGGGGIFNDGSTLTVTNSTFSTNRSNDLPGTSISNYDAGDRVYLAGNIFMDNTPVDNCDTINGNGGDVFIDNGYNLSDDASCVGATLGTGSANNATLLLGALTDNGGPTQTHLPGAGSEAIGAIPNGTTISNNGTIWTCDQSGADQRGESRPITLATACTAGAVEVELPPVCPSWTATTAAELRDCINLANVNESPSPTADTITLGADITLSTALPQIMSAITLEGAGYAVDGGNSVQLFHVASAGDFIVNQATLQNGYSATNGGGIYNDGTLTVSNSTFSGNNARRGSGIYNNDTLTVSNSTFSGNTAASEGGGIFNDGTLTVSNSTFSGNTAFGGGGIFNAGSLMVTNSTFSGNLADWWGGGILNVDTLTMTNSTFFGNSATNSAGGIYNSFGTVHLAGTIFAAGLNGDNCVNDSGTLTDNGYNLSDDASCVGATPGTGSANNATLNLDVLADNGGPTQTHLPSAGSDAIGAIPNGTTISNNGTTWTCDQSGTDQRGESRPINFLTACTAGAVEVAVPLCPAWTATTANQLYQCISRANNNESPSPTADTITLGADITLSTALPQIASAITLEGAGYAVDGGNSVRLFYVTSTGDFTVNQTTLQNGLADFNGGGIYNDGGTVSVTNSILSNNDAFNDGGGIYNNGGAVTVTNSTLAGSGATDGGGIYNIGTLAVTSSTLSDNNASAGGGIYNDGGTVTVTNSTFSGNTATTGGGIADSSGTVTVTNSTFFDDSVTFFGRSIYSSGIVHLAGNIFVSGATGNNCVNDGTLNDNGYNLSDDATCANGGTGSANNATLSLGALADNGGSTQTHLPGAGSDAIGVIPNGTTISNNGTSWTCDQSGTDQRGVSRPINSGDGCTAGAVEVAPICTSWTVTTAAELRDCITLANANESPSPTADTITLGTDIMLSAALPNITSEIMLEGAGYAVDGGNSVRIFLVESGGDFTVNQATLQNGAAFFGGGIYNDGGKLTVSNSSFFDNSVSDFGGGIYNKGTLAVTNSTFSGSGAHSGGGIYNDGTLTVSNSTFSDNSVSDFGGGIYSEGTLTVTNSTFSGNGARYGGGIFNNNTLTVSNSTFSGNDATDSGGGIFNNDISTVHLAGNLFVAGLSGDNCANNGTLNDNGYNLSDDASCVGATPGTGSANNATLNLGALADNGGSTQTHLPGTGSDAIGAIPYGTTISNNGTTWTCDQSGTDQRGELRPINSGEACTVGAVEVAGVRLTMQQNGYFSWLPAPSGSCSESLYRSSTPYVGHTWLTDDPANYDGSGSLTSVAVNYFYYLLVDCGGSQSQSNEVGEFTFAIVPGN